MFKSQVAGAVTLALLTNEVKAVKYRPPAGSNPWHKSASLGELVDPKYPINYFVPNFGVDREIKWSNDNLAEAEKKVGKKMTASFKKPPSHPMDYKVPDFGQDSDIRVSLGNLNDAERALNHKWVLPTKAQIKAGEYPMNYPVPNFGQDKDIKTSFENLNQAEKQLKRKWIVTPEMLKKKPPTDYKVPNFGVDHDILETKFNLENAEKALGHKFSPVKDADGNWVIPAPGSNQVQSFKSLVQTDADIKVESDPVCSSAGCNYASEKGPASHPMDYFVPNFGRDKDQVLGTWASIDWAQK